MSFSATLLTVHIYANAVLCAETLASAFLLYAIRHFFITSLNAMRIVRTLIVFVVIIPATVFFLPENNYYEPMTQIWSAPSMQEIAAYNSLSDIGSYFSVGAMNQSRIIYSHSIPEILINCIIFGVFVFSVRLFFNGMHIHRILRTANLFRSIGRVRVYASERTSVPFSLWLPGRFIVVVPTSIIGDAETFFISIYHELQHHRQMDTMWAYAIQVLKAFFLWNPFIYRLEKNVSEIQELACDECIIDRRKISPRAYSRCLIGIAELACKKRIPLCTIGMTTSLSGFKLKRRMNLMFAEKNRKKGLGSTLLCSALCFCFVATISFASQGVIRDRRISLEEAKKMLENVEKETAFPVVVNNSVLIQLNSYLGTPDGRNYIREALIRMEPHQEIIEKKISEYGAPKALLAVPIVESGYKNIPKGEKWGAGLWQFIPSTAKHFGLKVDDEIDERLDVDIETDAALRYLVANNLRFKDWGLSLLAYNAGAKTVQDGIDATGSRDPWTLIESGYENDEDYLSKIIAAIIIMYNPSSLE